MGRAIVKFPVIALHRRMPNLRRPFKVALYPWVPILGVLSCWLFVPALELRSFLLGGGLTIVGATIYLLRPVNRPRLDELSGTWRRMRLLASAKRRQRMRVLIIDGGQQGQNIAKRLLARDEYRLVFRVAEHQVTFIEEDEERCQELERLYNVPIYQGDGSKQEVLEQVGVENVDVAGLQALLAFIREREGIGPIKFLGTPPIFRKALELTGLGDSFAGYIA